MAPEADYLFLGPVCREFIVTAQGRFYGDVLGGEALYAAAGARLWTDSVALLSRIPADFPAGHLEDLQNAGFSSTCLIQTDEPAQAVTFFAYTALNERTDRTPAPHFLRLGIPLPKALLDYQAPSQELVDRETFPPLALRPTDLSSDWSGVRAAHLAPQPYASHLSLPVRLRELGVRRITLDPWSRYMEPAYERDLTTMLHGLDAFLPDLDEARAFFRPAEPDPWEMAEAFAACGVLVVAIKHGAGGVYLYDGVAKRRWHIPAYPAQPREVTGAGSAFAGGFLVGLTETLDPVQAALQGTISASIAIEGAGALSILEALPGLAQARLDALRDTVRAV